MELVAVGVALLDYVNKEVKLLAEYKARSPKGKPKKPDLLNE